MLDEVMKESFGVKGLNKLAFKSIKEEFADNKFIIYSLLISKYGIYISIASSLASILVKSYVKYQKMLTNRQLLVVMKIALLVYENEYKNKYGEVQ